LAISAGVVILLLGAVYAAAYVMAGDTLARDARVAGIELGGMTKDEARATLEQELPPLTDAPVTVDTGAGDPHTLEPGEAGLRVDIDKTLQRVSGGSANPVDLARALFGGADVAPVVDIDRDQLESALGTIAEESDVQRADGTVGFSEGEVVVEDPVIGRTLQVGEAADLVEDRYTTTVETATPDESAVEVPVEETPPEIDQAEIDRAVSEVAEPAMSGSITVTAGDSTTEVTPEILSQALSMSANEGTLELAMDSEALIEASSTQLDELGEPPEDAPITISGGEPTVGSGSTGLAVQPEAYATEVQQVLTATGDARAVTLEQQEVQPDLTKAEAQDLGVTEVVSEYTTEFPHAEYRNVNIGRAAELMQNTLVQPGETFSLNDTVGERTEANGFTSGTIISEGQFTEALGGGVSQVATTAYNAGFFAGLKDVEHQPHSFYIDRYPEGREATVAWPYLDMAFQNDTDYGVLVDTSFSESSPGSSGSITVRLWSTKHRDVETSTSDRSAITDYEQVTESGEDCVPQQGTNGFDVTVNRVIRENGSVIADEDIHTTYNPAAAITCQ